jgi:hypothetical protein
MIREAAMPPEEKAAEKEKKEQEVEVQVDLNDPKLFLNRELSLLDFQGRVLEEALDESRQQSG